MADRVPVLLDASHRAEPNRTWTGRGDVVKKTSWSLLRSQLEPRLELELRVCIEVLWVLPAPGASLPSVLLPSNVMVRVDGTVSFESTLAQDLEQFAHYLAPELKPSDAAPWPPQATLAAAIYAVGALLFEAISGKSFTSALDVEREIRYGRARAAATGLAKDIAEIRLLEIAAKATRSIPELRWATPEAFSRELGRAAGHCMATREDLARQVASLLAPKQADFPSLPVGTLPFASRIKTLRGIAVDLSRYPTPPTPTPPKASAEVSDQLELAVVNSIHPQAELPWSAARRNQKLALAGLVATMLVALPLAFIGVLGWNAPVPTPQPKSATALHRQRPAPDATAASVLQPAEVLFSESTDATAPPCAAPKRETENGGALESNAERDKQRAVAKPIPPRHERRIPDYGI